MFRSTRLLLMLAVAISVVVVCTPASALTWELASSFSSSYTLATPDDTSDPTTHAKFSTTGDLPSSLLATPGFMPNMKVTYNLTVTGVSGWGAQRAGQGGVAMFLGATPDPTMGLYSGVHYEGYSNRGALTAAAARSANPGGTVYADTSVFTGEITVVGGVATTTLTSTASDAAVTTQTYTLTSTDISNLVGKSKFAAFKALGLSGDYNYQYGRAFISNLAFYRDSDQSPPQGTLSGAVTLNGTTLGTGATVSSSDGAYSTTVDSSGNYGLVMAPGTYTMLASLHGYATSQVTGVVIQNGQTTTQNFKLAGGTVAGSVTYNGSATDGAGATVRTQDSAYSATADGSGAYSLRLPPGTYTLVCHLFGSYTDVTQSGVVITDEATTNLDFVTTGPNWVQVATDAGPYVTPAMLLTQPSFSPTYGVLPSVFNIIGTYLPNIKITYHIQHQSYYWENEALGFGGLAIWGDASNMALGLFSGINGGNTGGANWINGPLVLNTSSSSAPPNTINTATTADMTVQVVSAVASVQSSAHPGASSIYNITPADIASWAGNSKYAAFEGGHQYWQYARQTITNITFYKDINQAPPPKGTITGTVTMNYGTSHPAAVGATVAITGDGSTITDSAGFYTMEVPPGTYTITYSKANCDTLVESNVAVADQQTVTLNKDLPTSFISGTITSAIPGNPGVAGVAVSTTDGIASAVTNSAGAYTLQVHSGSYSIYAYKHGFVPVWNSRTVGQQATVAYDVTLNPGWDLAGDFGTPNPHQEWSYYYDNGTATLMTANGYPWAGASSLAWCATTNYAAFVKNYSLVPRTTWLPTIDVFREGGKVVATSNVNPYKVLARFTAPTSGYYRITGRWAAAQPAGGTSGIGLKYNGVWMYGADNGTDASYKTISGFAGSEAAGYTDAFGLNPVETYSIDMDLTTGEYVETVVQNETGWCQTDLTITSPPSICYVTGRVTAANMPGNYGVAAANVRAMGFNSTYVTTTDSAGYYVLAIQPDTYTLQADSSGYALATVSNVVLSFGNQLTQNFALTHGTTWNLESDFNNVANPNGQWMYGHTAGTYTTDPATMLMWDLLTTMSGLTGAMPVWTYPAGGSPNPWYCWIGKNTTGAPVNVTHGQQVSYVENNQMSYGGGGGWWNSTPVGAVFPRIRWTAPDQRIIKLNLTITNQDTNGGVSNLTLVRNNSIMLTKSASGFMGRAVNQYSDSIGPSPQATFETQLLVTSGDIIDFMQGKDNGMGWWVGCFGSPAKSMGLSIIINQGDGQICNSIAEVKAKPVGTTVFLVTPTALECPSNVFTDYSFYLENDDRSQGIKCIGSPDLPVYAASTDSGYKITLTGKVVTDSFGQTVLEVQSINSALLSAPLKPLGMVAKTVTASNTLVRVWGRVIEKVADPAWTGDPAEHPYQWQYWTINDGSQNIKILMNVQNNWMSTPNIPDPVVNTDYVAVTGIATLDSTGALVVMPWRDLCIKNYTDGGL